MERALTERGFPPVLDPTSRINPPPNKDPSKKDEELRTLLQKRGYRILELSYGSYTDKKRDELYREILSGLGK